MDEKLFESIVEEAKELTQKQDFKKFTTVKFKKKMGIVQTRDFLKGIKIGHIIGMSQAIANEKKFDELLVIVKNYLNKTDKILKS